MKNIRIALLAALVLPLSAQTVVRWVATTGDVSLSPGATAATIQQPATNGSQALIDQVQVYCSVACTVSQAANGAAATTTAGSITPILPSATNTPILLNFFTASNVGSGTAQGGLVHIPAGATVVLCLSTTCGAAAQVIVGPGGGTASNYTVSIASITGTANITFYGRLSQ